MSTSFHVRIEKEDMVFSAAHFITYGDNICERMHGHNYRAIVDVEGPLGPHGYVVDFIALHAAVIKLTRAWDHHVLLPTLHPRIRVVASASEVTAEFELRRWVLPREDCVLLPIENTTAELLAKSLSADLERRVPSFGGENLRRIEVRIDENHGQWGRHVVERMP